LNAVRSVEANVPRFSFVNVKGLTADVRDETVWVVPVVWMVPAELTR
jgi:hypothetical protein